MMTVNEVKKLTGVSIRTLQYYDTIGLLKPIKYTESGYRLYDGGSLERLQQILLFKELEFSLKEIKQIIDAPDFDRNKALEQQIELLTMKKEHLENLINFARGIKMLGVNNMDFTVFDTKKIDEYKEFEENAKQWTGEEQQFIVSGLMKIFAEFGQMMSKEPSNEQVQEQVKKLQDYISEHFYKCTKEILASLGKMYAGGGEFTENIDKACGTGTADFAAKAIELYCRC